MDSSTFIQLTIHGLIISAAYALLGIGFALIWRVSGIVNLLHGEVMFAGAVLASGIHGQIAPIGYVISLIAGVSVAFLLSFLIYRMVLSQLDNPIQEILFLLLLKALFALIGFEVILAPAINPAWRIGQTPLTISQPQLAISLIAVLALGVFLVVYYRFQIGRILRAVAEHSLAARFLGIDVNRIKGIGFAIGVTLALVAGILLSQLAYFGPGNVTAWTLKAFAIIALAGLRSIGSVIGGAVSVALLETYLVASMGTGSAQVILLLLTGVLLLVRLPSLSLYLEKAV